MEWHGQGRLWPLLIWMAHPNCGEMRSVAETLRKGTRITGGDRRKLAADLKSRYDAGESIRSLASATGRSYGFVHRILTENGVSLRGRGGTDDHASSTPPAYSGTAARASGGRSVAAGTTGRLTASDRLQVLVGGLDEEQAERALQLLSPLTGADARPDQQVRQLPAFVGIGDSGRSDISEHVDDLLAGGFGE